MSGASGVVSRALLIVLALAAGGARGENFHCPDAAITAAAEAARLNSARFWAGADLPGPWSHPCPIEIQERDRAAGGAATFCFDRGEVSGWQLKLVGRRDEILRDVLPHEVDHMVRASLIRRPVARWLDEGCAVLMESSQSHSAFRSRLPQYLHEPLPPGFLDASEYPSDPREIDRLYVVGFSLVEYLIGQGGPARLLTLQRMDGKTSANLERIYGHPSDHLLENWRHWAEARASTGSECVAVGCHRHGRDNADHSPAASRSLLMVYTADWCGPCRRFWRDFHADAEFRSTLQDRFHIQTVDVDRQPQTARIFRVDSVPTFITAAGRLVGYDGKEVLLRALVPPSPKMPETRIAAPATPAAPGGQSEPAADEPAPKPEEIPPELEREPAPPDARPTPDPSQPAEASGNSQAQTTNWLGRVLRLTPSVLTTLELIGVIGGSAATGGAGVLAAKAALALLRRRRARRSSPSQVAERQGGPDDVRAPFPRELDEARELVRLRQSEGRVAVLDALRGMFLDDELERFEAASPEQAPLARRLREAIDQRVSEVAPLTVDARG